MAAVLSPITRQVSKEPRELQRVCVDIHLEDVQDCLVYDQRGGSVPFKNLYQHGKSVIIFVRVSKVYESYSGLNVVLVYWRLSVCFPLEFLVLRLQRICGRSE